MFWRLTPRALTRVMLGAAAGARQAHNQAMRQAYVTAYLGRVKKWPKLDTLLVKDAPKRRRVKQDWREALRAVTAWVGSS